MMHCHRLNPLPSLTLNLLLAANLSSLFTVLAADKPTIYSVEATPPHVLVEVSLQGLIQCSALSSLAVPAG